MRKRLFAIISIILCISTLFSLTGCVEPVNSNIESTAGESDTATLTDIIQSGTQSDTQAVISTETLTDILQSETLSDTLLSTDSQAPAQTLYPNTEEIQIQTQTQPQYTQDLTTESIIEIESETQTETELEIGSESQTETQTEKSTEKQTEKKTEKQTEKETDPIPGKSKAPSSLKSKTYNLGNPTDRKKFKVVGRAQYTSTGILFDHCANAIEFQGYMTGDLKLNANSSGDNKNDYTYLTVFIDGKRVDKRFVIEGLDQTITLATFTGNYFHTVRIIKQTELSNSDARLKSITMKGYLTEAPAEREYYIEFYGDSLTAGYSNIATKDYPTSEEGDAIYQDATQTYAFLASETLKADCSILAMSGVGLDQGWTSNNFMHYFSKQSYRRGNDAYNFTGARVPDLVVIHLGANDVTCGSSRSKFVENATALINYIHKGYGKKIPIIWAYDPGEQVPDSWREEVLNKFSSTTKVYSLKLEWRSQGKINGHPNVAGHKKNATELVNLIKSKKLLK